MLFRQLFDPISCTYTYLIASSFGREALIVDPVHSQLEQYIQLISELDLKLVLSVDTHMHADHITATGPLKKETGCGIAMGERTRAEHVTIAVKEGETLNIDGISLEAIYTPGHTDDSFSFHLGDRLLTGDTLLIRGSGRTDFQNGNPHQQYDSIFNKLLRFPEETLVFPAHDYKGMTCSTIGEEKRHNPRLQVQSAEEYVEIMNNLKLAKPQMMDVAIPANLRCGL